MGYKRKIYVPSFFYHILLNWIHQMLILFAKTLCTTFGYFFFPFKGYAMGFFFIPIFSLPIKGIIKNVDYIAWYLLKYRSRLKSTVTFFSQSIDDKMFLKIQYVKFKLNKLRWNTVLIVFSTSNTILLFTLL